MKIQPLHQPARPMPLSPAKRALLPLSLSLLIVIMFSCSSPRDRQVEGLIRLREAKKGMQVQGITIDAARTTSAGELIFYHFTTAVPDSRNIRDTILVVRTFAGNLREVP